MTIVGASLVYRTVTRGARIDPWERIEVGTWVWTDDVLREVNLAVTAGELARLTGTSGVWRIDYDREGESP